MTVDAEAIDAAHGRIAEHLDATPLVVSEPLSARVGATIAIQSEHRQRTGSFKVRGALNRLLTLDDERRAAGVVTASSGNHGIATATAARLAGTTCTVHLPETASTAKVAAIRRAGADIVSVPGSDSGAAEVAARRSAERSGATYVSPYNDPAIVAGQGTIAVDLTARADAMGLGPIDAVVASVGGGGLVSGVAAWLARDHPHTTIVGASPHHDRAMAASVEAGAVVAPDARPTFSDGTAGSIEPGTITFELCRDLVDTWIDVTESEIARAVTDMIDHHHELVEGAAGVAIAAAQRWARENPGSTVVAISCGANVSSATLRRIIETARSEDDATR